MFSNSTASKLSIIFRLCDAKNLNISPLCDISPTGYPAKWAPEVESLYANGDKPGYVESLPSPIRYNYHTEKLQGGELLQTLTKVFM